MFESDNQNEEYPSNIETEHNLKEDIFRRIVESAPNAIVLINQHGKIILINAQTEKLFGYKRDELLNQTVEILIPSHFRSKHPNYRKEFFLHPSTRPMGAGRDLFGLHKNGNEIPVEIGLNPIESNNEVFILGSIIDITERKRAEEKLKRVIEATPSAIVLVNSERKITLVNTQMEKLFGYSRNELIGKEIKMLLPSDSQDTSNKQEDFFSTPVTRPIIGHNLTGRHKNSKNIPLEIGLNPIESEEGTLVLASIIDITDRLRAAAKKEEEAELSAQHQRELTKLAELERFHKLTIGRELKMIELKKEIEELKVKLNEYESKFNQQ